MSYWSKYWPNEIPNSAVDDQDDDTSSDPATTTNLNGGKLSFFAYAPYVDASLSSTYGIIKINESTTLTGSASTPSENGPSGAGNQKRGNPTVQYKIAQGASETAKNVDLLWGKYNMTDKNALNQNNEGGRVYGNWLAAGSADNFGNVSEDKTVYGVQMPEGYETNINLTKQSTNGTVGFLFKHALSKIGGPQVGDGPVNGLMAILDIDDFKGAETGGTKEDVTIVTIKSIKIENATGKDAAASENEKKFWDTATLDLATGHWNFNTPAADLLYEIGDLNTDTRNATLNPLLAEPEHNSDHKWATDHIQDVVSTPANWAAFYKSATDGDVKGVLTTKAQNVYKDSEESPLFFFPGSKPDLNITIDYVVRTKDENLKLGYSEVEQVITKHITFANPVEMNKQYNLLMHIGLTSVKFTATVSDWDNTTDTNGDGEVEEITDVFVPRNVGGIIASYSDAASNATSLAATETPYYYEDAVKKTIGTTWVGFEGGHPAWITDVANNGTLTLTANTSYQDRTGTIRIKDKTATDAYVYSDYITITQKGRIPEAATVTWSTDPALGTYKAVGGQTVPYASSSVMISGKESDNSTVFSGADHTSEYIFAFSTNSSNFVDDVNWITVDGSNFVVAPNTTGSPRTAQLYVYIQGKYVPVTSTTLTQN